MTIQTTIDAAHAQAALFDAQITNLSGQVAYLTEQRDLHNAAAEALAGLSDEHKAILDALTVAPVAEEPAA